MSGIKGKGLKLKYFVLKPKSMHKLDLYAKASRDALMAYARVIRRENPDLARDLEDWVSCEVADTISRFHPGSI